MRLCGEVGGGGAIIKKKEFVVCLMFDVIYIKAINGNIFIQFIRFMSGLNLYDGQLFIHSSMFA